MKISKLCSVKKMCLTVLLKSRNGGDQANVWR